jgi:hypothetical protein
MSILFDNVRVYLGGAFFPGQKNLIEKGKVEDGAVMLEPNVLKYFSNSELVNKALRMLIAIIPTKKHASAHTK